MNAKIKTNLDGWNVDYRVMALNPVLIFIAVTHFGMGSLFVCVGLFAQDPMFVLFPTIFVLWPIGLLFLMGRRASIDVQGGSVRLTQSWLGLFQRQRTIPLTDCEYPTEIILPATTGLRLGTVSHPVPLWLRDDVAQLFRNTAKSAPEQMPDAPHALEELLSDAPKAHPRQTE